MYSSAKLSGHCQRLLLGTHCTARFHGTDISIYTYDQEIMVLNVKRPYICIASQIV